MATLEKPKRGFMKFYKSKSKNHHIQKPDPNVVTNKPMMSSTISLPRKSDYSCEESIKPMMSPTISLPRKSDYSCEESIKPMMSPTILLPRKSDYSYEETIKPMMSPMIMPRKSNYNKETVEDGPRRSVDGGVGRKMMVVEVPRRSVSHVETNLASVVAFLQVKILVTDMPGFMQVHAFRCARKTFDSLEKFSAKHMAYNLKKEFDKVYGPAWHCIVGSSFGSFVTHSTGGFLYFSMENLYILVFKTKVEKVLD